MPRLCCLIWFVGVGCLAGGFCFWYTRRFDAYYYSLLCHYYFDFPGGLLLIVDSYADLFGVGMCALFGDAAV